MIREETISLGSIIKIHALKGELLLATEFNLDVIQITTEWIFFDYQGQLVPFFVEYLDATGSSNALLKVEEINSIDQAKEWIGKGVYIPSGSITKIKPKRQSIHILQGFQVKDEKYGILGSVNSIIEHQNNPLIQILHSEKEILIPLSDSIIIKIDHKKRILHIRAPEGLIDLYLAQ
jgi:16S rRNA processing protein RimM